MTDILDKVMNELQFCIIMVRPRLRFPFFFVKKGRDFTSSERRQLAESIPSKKVFFSIIL